MKVFILGRPGSGKSHVARRLEELTKDYWSPKHINDYTLLCKMFVREQEEALRSSHKQRQFLSTGTVESTGFDVQDFSVLNTVLKSMEEIVCKREKNFSRRKKLFLLEFARNDYAEALCQFSPDFLQDALFLYLAVDSKRCIERIHERIRNPATLNDHFVSDEIMRTYYSHDDCSDSQTIHLKGDLPSFFLHLDLPHTMDISIVRIHNTGSIEQLYASVEKIAGILEKPVALNSSKKQINQLIGSIIPLFKVVNVPVKQRTRFSLISSLCLIIVASLFLCFSDPRIVSSGCLPILFSGKNLIEKFLALFLF